MSNGIAKKNVEDYHFVEMFGLQFAQIDEEGYGYLIRWPNGTYNSLKIKLIWLLKLLKMIEN